MRYKTLLCATGALTGAGIFIAVALMTAKASSPLPEKVPPAAGILSKSLVETQPDSILDHARKHSDKTYICPMHPHIIQHEPGNCPICGMELVEQNISTSATSDFGPPIVTVRPETVQNMGVRTARVELGSISRQIDTVGFVTYDEDRMSHVHTRVEGWIEKLAVRSEGEHLTRGQPLFYLYSPELLNAQEEYLLALQQAADSAATRGRDLLAGAQRRLQLLEIPQALIDDLRKTRRSQQAVPVLAPADGVVMKLSVREGMYVKPEMELFAISDVASVWVQAQVFEHQSGWVQTAQPAQIKVAAAPGRSWQGAVDYVYPELDPVTRTLRVRLRFANPDGSLKPNMFAQAVIHSAPQPNVLTIPRDALIVTGGEERVVVALGDGRFQSLPVVSGMRVQDRVEIVSGLDEGQEVVVSGQFLIDSESNLQASFRRMTALPEPAR
jgi:Cu(I)/Ag(I) efflux system membrane fusion protein